MNLKFLILALVLVKLTVSQRNTTNFYARRLSRARPKLRLNTDLRAKTYARQSYHSAQWANNFRNFYGNKYDRTDDYGRRFRERSNYFYRDYENGPSRRFRDRYRLSNEGYGYYGNNYRINWEYE